MYGQNYQIAAWPELVSIIERQISFFEIAYSTGEKKRVRDQLIKRHLRCLKF